MDIIPKAQNKQVTIQRPQETQEDQSRGALVPLRKETKYSQGTTMESKGVAETE